MSKNGAYTYNTKTNTYHFPGCPYLKRTSKANKKSAGVMEVLDRNLVPCKHCQSMRYIYKAGKDGLTGNMKSKKLSHRLYGNWLLVQTDVSFWKIGYDRNRITFFLYHGNFKPKSNTVDIHGDNEYHRQNDVPEYTSINKYLNYIVEHDRFRRGVYDGRPRGSAKQRKKYAKAKDTHKRAERRKVYTRLKKFSKRGSA